MKDAEFQGFDLAAKLFNIQSTAQNFDIEYEHISENPEDNLVITVFTSCLDWQRVTIPFKTYGKLGGSIKIVKPLVAQEISYLENSKFFIINKVISLEYFEIVKKIAREIGALLIYDLDDNMHEVLPSNSNYHFYDRNDELGCFHLYALEKIISECDYCIYSTRELAAYYKDINPNFTVFPNYLDIDERYKNVKPIDWKNIASNQECKFNDDTKLIGFFGSQSHIDDLEILRKPITKILNENKNTLFALMTSQETIISKLIYEWRLPKNRFLYFPFQNIVEYPKYVANFDIGLAPLLTNLFNLGKSNLKLLEYGALGIPYVASKVANYQRFQIESKGVGGFTCSSEDDWYENLSFLLRETEVCKKMSSDLKQYVYNQYDISKIMPLLCNMLRTINQNSINIRKKPNLYELYDCKNGIPFVENHYDEKSICPCGSGDKYIECKNECYPAWGEIVKEEECQSNN